MIKIGQRDGMYLRVSKPAAKAAYRRGIAVYATPCKCSPSSAWTVAERYPDIVCVESGDRDFMAADGGYCQKLRDVRDGLKPAYWVEIYDVDWGPGLESVVIPYKGCTISCTSGTGPYFVDCNKPKHVSVTAVGCKNVYAVMERVDAYIDETYHGMEKHM